MSVRKVCGYAKKYKGIKKPTCGCDFCNSVWEENQLFGVQKLTPPTGKVFKMISE